MSDRDFFLRSPCLHPVGQSAVQAAGERNKKSVPKRHIVFLIYWSAAPADVAALNQKAADAILAYVKTQNLDVQNLAVAFDGASMTATVSGTAADQAPRKNCPVLRQRGLR